MKPPSKGDEELVLALDPTKGDEDANDDADYSEEANDAAASLRAALASEDDAAIVDAFRALKAVC